MIKKIALIITLFLIIVLVFFIWSGIRAATPPVCTNPDHICNASACPAGCSGADDPDCYPAGCCGDNKIQSPNGENPAKYEKCDDGGIETDQCTAFCGQKMLGWAWPDGNSGVGWLSLNPDNCLPEYLDPNLPAGACQEQTINYYTQATENDEIKGYAWADSIGWVCFGLTCAEPAVILVAGDATPPTGDLKDLKASIVVDPSDPENPQITGWAKALTLGTSGWISLNCSNNNSCAAADYKVRLAKADFGQEPSIEQRLTLKGWAWNDNSQGTGLGYIQFYSPSAEVPPWIQTKYSDIYARKFTSEKPPPGYNATYQILAGGSIVNFRSAEGLSWLNENFGPINFPTPETRYSNILGQLDINGLICTFVNDNCVNQYGTTVKKIASMANLEEPLNGKIYYYRGNLTVGNFEFKNGANFANGAGTIIIDGNLTIDGNITYDTKDDLTKFRNLASVAWIIKGDLKIAPAVEELAGNFIVIGNGTACKSDGEVSSCGQIYSCEPFNETSCKKRLTVSGLMMARKFYFTREFSAYDPEVTRLGSEVIIYDGRLLANTPPGLGDFAKALPIWRSGVFSR